MNIGAGFDTLYWRLVDEGKTVKGFVEFDFPGVTSRKCLYIQRTKQLLQAVSDEGKMLYSTSFWRVAQTETWLV